MSECWRGSVFLYDTSFACSTRCLGYMYSKWAYLLRCSSLLKAFTITGFRRACRSQFQLRQLNKLCLLNLWLRIASVPLQLVVHDVVDETSNIEYIIWMTVKWWNTLANWTDEQLEWGGYVIENWDCHSKIGHIVHCSRLSMAREVSRNFTRWRRFSINPELLRLRLNLWLLHPHSLTK